MSDIQDFLSAIYGPYEGEITAETAADGTVFPRSRGEIEAEPGCYISLKLPDDQACAVYGVMEEAPRGAYLEFQKKPSVALFKRTHPEEDEGTTIAVWALESVFPMKSVTPLADALGSPLDEFLPTPGANGWVLVHDDANIFYSLGEMMDTYGPKDEPVEEDEPAVEEMDPVDEELVEEIADDYDHAPTEEIEADGSAEDDFVHDEPVAEDTPPWEDEPEATQEVYEPVYWGDAEIMNVGWHPEQDPRLAQEMIVSIGPGAQSTAWKATKPMPILSVYKQLCQHKIGPKDGTALVYGEVIGGKRVANAMKALWGVGVDLDTGMPIDEVLERIGKLGLACVVNTTSSHGKTSSSFSKARVTKFADGREIDTDLCRDFLRSLKYDEAIIASAEFDTIEHEAEGIKVLIDHAPMPKCRAFFPYLSPYVIQDEAPDQKASIEKSKKIPLALAAMAGLELDVTGVDPSRLFYLPRHAQDKPYGCFVFEGELFDWRSLDLDDPYAKLAADIGGAAKGKGKTSTPEGRELLRWGTKAAHGFQINDMIREYAEDRIRNDAGDKLEIECPFDENHHNAGDPDDRACMTVNAGDGPSPIFTASCRHETCQVYSAYDMLAKMLKDGWAPPSVLEDESFNAAAPEQASNPAAAVRIAEADNVKKTLDEMIGALNTDMLPIALEEAVDAVMVEVSKLDSSITQEVAIKSIQARTRMKIAHVRGKLTSKPREENATEPKAIQEVKDKGGRVIFKHPASGFNIDEAKDACRRTLRRANDKPDDGGDPMPRFSCNMDEVRRMKVSENGKIEFSKMTPASFAAELGEMIYFQRSTDAGDGHREAVPPPVASAVFETCWKHLPVTPEVIYTPIYNKDGQLLSDPGWYTDLNIIMADTGFTVPPVSQDPTDDEVAAALSLLKDDVLGDFPFLDIQNGVERRAPSEANAMAMIITPFMRRMISGCTPVFAISKPTPGTGGTILGRVSLMLFDGHEGFPLAYHANNDDEMRKALLTAVMETRSHLFFDDVSEFNSQVLLQSITAREIGGRILGQSLNVSRPNLFNWIMTGNNPYIKSDMARRLCEIRLNAKTADIQSRVFRHSDFPGFIMQNRSRIVHAILTLIQAWMSKGSPNFNGPKIASFEEWGRMVGGVLQNAGVEGFLENPRPIGSDIEDGAKRRFLKVWMQNWGHTPMTARDMFTFLMSMDDDILTGNSEEQKKVKFRNRLESMEGQTHKINLAKRDQPPREELVIVKKVLDAEGDVAYVLGIVPQKEDYQ